MIDHELTLHYRLAPGWLSPWVTALAEGRALAAVCDGCGRVSFPPLRRCRCGRGTWDWRELAGTARILRRSTGADGDFALAAFDGADTRTTVRLLDLGPGAIAGKLRIPPTDAAAAMILGPLDQEEGS